MAAFDTAVEQVEQEWLLIAGEPVGEFEELGAVRITHGGLAEPAVAGRHVDVPGQSVEPGGRLVGVQHVSPFAFPRERSHTVSSTLGGRYYESREFLHNPLADDGRRRSCAAIVVCPWTSFANCWTGMCVPI